MKRIEEINKLIGESEKAQKKLCEEYSKKLSLLTKDLKQEYFPRISDEVNKKKVCKDEIFYFWVMVSIDDKFDIDILGKVLAKLLSRISGQEYLYGYLETCMYKGGTVPEGYASIIYPKDKFVIDGKMHSLMSIGELIGDESIIVLDPFANKKHPKEISFYSYNKINNPEKYYIEENYPFISVRYPEVKEFIDYVLETHAINGWERLHTDTPITEDELNMRMVEYLDNYESKKSYKKTKN